MNKDELKTFLKNIGRSEMFENYRSYSKGVRVALINVGNDEKWVNGEFRDALDALYNRLSSPEAQAEFHKKLNETLSRLLGKDLL